MCIRTGILFSFQTNKFRFMAIISAAFCCHRKATSKRRRSSYRAWPLLYTVSQYRAVVVGGRIIICPPPIAIPNKLAGNMKRQRLPPTSSSGWSLRTTVCTRQEDIYILLVDERQCELWVATIDWNGGFKKWQSVRRIQVELEERF